MPRFPHVSAPAAAIPASIFSRLVERLAQYQGEIYPFHLGDTYLPPPEEARLETLRWEEPNGAWLYRYSAPAGEPELLAAVVDKLRRKNGLEVGPANVQITAGATHAFACAARALLDQGDEVLLLAPFWPLIRGHVLSVGARPVEVPFSSELYARPGVDPRTLVEPYVTPRTAAMYLSTPNNPDGKVLGARELEAIAALARERNLWVLADEVYEDFTFDGRRHASIAALPGMAERTVTAFSFSKSYGQAGLRVGYVVGPEPVIAAIRKLANHSIYNVPRATQRAALCALRHGEGFLARARDDYAGARDEAVAALERLGLPHAAPEGGSYVFVNLGRHLAAGERAVDVLERLAGQGILLAPGDAFGHAYASWARLCYTAVPRPRLREGLVRMAALLARG